MSKRSVFQILFAGVLFFSSILTYYSVRLGIVGIVVSAFLIFEIRFSLIKNMPILWKRLGYWQKWAMAFGFIHIVLFVCVLLLLEFHYEFGKGNGIELMFLVLELPLLFIEGSIIGQIVHTLIISKIYYFYFLVFGTLAYAFLGAILGSIIDFVKYLMKSLIILTNIPRLKRKVP